MAYGSKTSIYGYLKAKKEVDEDKEKQKKG